VVDREYKGKIPRLEEVFLFCKDKVFMNIELKDKDIKTTTKLVLELIKEYNNHNQLCISSFNHEYSKELNTYQSEIQFQFLYNDDLVFENPKNEIYDNKQGTVNLFYGCVTQELVNEIHSRNFGVMVWCNKRKAENITVEETEETFLKLINMGVDIICANKPELVLSARKRYIKNYLETMEAIKNIETIETIKTIEANIEVDNVEALAV